MYGSLWSLLWSGTCSCLSRGVLTQGVIYHVFAKVCMALKQSHSKKFWNCATCPLLSEVFISSWCNMSPKRVTAQSLLGRSWGSGRPVSLCSDTWACIHTAPGCGTQLCRFSSAVCLQPPLSHEWRRTHVGPLSRACWELSVQEGVLWKNNLCIISKQKISTCDCVFCVVLSFIGIILIVYWCPDGSNWWLKCKNYTEPQSGTITRLYWPKLT